MDRGDVMKAITLIRPWPWAILHAGKRIENRSWAPSLKPGDLLAIHAGNKWDQVDANWIARYFNISVPSKADHVAGAIVGIARFVGVVYKSPNEWFFGPVGWLLDDVRAIDPIPCRGALGLWSPSADIQAQIKLLIT